MKLIIDILDKDYKSIKDNPSVWGRWVQTIIANGIPYEERPQGEWLLLRTNYEDSGNNFYECSNCHHTDVHADSVEVSYCWHCGAEMKEARKNDK